MRNDEEKKVWKSKIQQLVSMKRRASPRLARVGKELPKLRGTKRVEYEMVVLKPKSNLRDPSKGARGKETQHRSRRRGCKKQQPQNPVSPKPVSNVTASKARGQEASPLKTRSLGEGKKAREERMPRGRDYRLSIKQAFIRRETEGEKSRGRSSSSPAAGKTQNS